MVHGPWTAVDATVYEAVDTSAYPLSLDTVLSRAVLTCAVLTCAAVYEAETQAATQTGSGVGAFHLGSF